MKVSPYGHVVPAVSSIAALAQRCSQPPLVLKLIMLHDGKHPVCLVTNDLALRESEASEMSRQRWGIEVCFRTVKQSAQRRKLTCHPATARPWHID